MFISLVEDDGRKPFLLSLFSPSTGEPWPSYRATKMGVKGELNSFGSKDRKEGDGIEVLSLAALLQKFCMVEKCSEGGKVRKTFK